MMEQFISLILKNALTPIIVEELFKSAGEIWKYNKFASLILYLTGFLLTPFGIFLGVACIILFILWRNGYFR